MMQGPSINVRMGALNVRTVLTLCGRRQTNIRRMLASASPVW